MTPDAASRFRLIAIGAASGPRRDSITETYGQMAGRPSASLSWAEALGGGPRFASLVDADSFIRFDSPDQDRTALAALYRLGEGLARAAGLETLSAEQFAATRDGDIGSPGQLACGLARASGQLGAAGKVAGARVSVDAADLACAFDKPASLARLAAAGIPVPDILPIAGGFDALEAAMARAPMPRVFVKLRHGSAAAAMVALARHGADWIATTTAVIGEDGRPYATRAVRRLRDRQEIAAIVDRLAPLGLHVERWLPKFGIDGRTIDLRLVVIGGEQVFAVVRASRHPMTNLHIGGERSPADALAAQMGDTAWNALLDTGRRAARQFPSALAVGIDMAVLADGRRHIVLEVNIFGDHIRDFAVAGQTIHQAQVSEIARIMAAQRLARQAEAA